VNKRHGQRGFSIVEIGVTLAVFAVLAAAAVPSVGQWIRNTKVRNTAESVLSGLQRARAEAIRRNVNVSFWMVAGADERVLNNGCALSSASGSWVVGINNPAGKCASAVSSTVDPMVLESHAAGDGGGSVTVAALAADGSAAQCVRFNGFGQVVNSTTPPDDACRLPGQIATVNISHSQGDTRRLRITVTAQGAIRLCDQSVSAPDPRACPV